MENKDEYSKLREKIGGVKEILKAVKDEQNRGYYQISGLTHLTLTKATTDLLTEAVTNYLGVLEDVLESLEGDT